MNVRKALIVGATAGLMATAAIACQAVTVSFASEQPATAPPPGTIDWSVPLVGIDSDTGVYTNQLTAAGNNTFPNQSQIVYFQNLTFDNASPATNHTDTWNTRTGVYFDYQVAVNGGAPEFFRVVGNMSGSMTYNTVSGANSLAHWVPLAFYMSPDELAWSSVPFVTAPDPITAAPSDRIDVHVDGVPVAIYIYQTNPLTAPIEPPPFPIPTEASINGYIQAVPEPGTLALLMCSGVAGSLFLMRRRRA